MPSRFQYPQYPVMKQLLQNIATGAAAVVDIPSPEPRRGEVLVRVGASLVSFGTERMVVQFAKKNLVQKALARPDLVRQVVDKARREGILSVLDAVRTRLDSDMALGYSNAGTVVAVGAEITEFKVGDRVACAGGSASHAELVRVPRNLVCAMPSAPPGQISFEEAAFTTIGAIALHGLRLASVQLGETVAVIGLGLVGLLAVQLARAAGCTVFGTDPDPWRCRLAEELGCEAAIEDADRMRGLVASRTSSVGVDAVLITAATSSNGPLELSAHIARDRAHVIAVGAVGLNIPRKPYYEKELQFQVSRSYGPGRYDPDYEEHGFDYPIGFVRWTENRNMGAFLQLVSDGKLQLAPLITHRFPIQEAEKAYDLISSGTREPALGVLITYDEPASSSTRVETQLESKTVAVGGKVAIGLAGAGSFAVSTLIPTMRKVPGTKLVGICASSGISARHAGARHGFRFCCTSFDELLREPQINTIVIATRHHLHAEQISAALLSGKNVFCEKPLCIEESELIEITQLRERLTRRPGPAPLLTVGFNRRFSPMAQRLYEFLQPASEPLVMHYRVNAGFLPLTHWTQDPAQGGGRIIGEICHFVDFLSFLADSLVTSAQVETLPNLGRYRDDNLVATLWFENASVGAITYVANGDKAFAKERLEVFCGGTAAVLDDFRHLEMLRNGRRTVVRSRWHQDKGHRGQWESWVRAVSGGGAPPISFREMLNTTLTTFKMVQACTSRARQAVDTDDFINSALARRVEAI